jgi:membrane protease YdiL (CAAX protease family)
MQKISIHKSLVIIGCFLAYKYSKYAYAYLIFGKERWVNWPELLPSSIMLVTGIFMAFAANYWINKRIRLSDFGMSPDHLVKGLISAVLFSLPMFLTLGFLNQFKFQPTFEILFRGIILAGFGEEYLYRAFLFGFLFYYARWGFLSAGIFTGILFAAGHLYQAGDLASALSILVFTTGASLGFAWFYYTWNSLWMVLFLHGFMDVIWDSFHVETNVTGSLWINIGRFTTLAIAVFYSIKIARENQRLDLKSKLWIN